MLKVLFGAVFGAVLWSGLLAGPASGAPRNVAGALLLAQGTPSQTAQPAPPQAVPGPALPAASAPPVTPALPPSTSEPALGGTPPANGEPHRGVPRGPAPGDAAPASPIPAASGSPPGRFHLHRPGTDVDGDSLTGSLASQAYILKGNVTLHSDPKIDREIADASESQEPLTLTADEIDVDRLGYSYVAKGHVRFVQGTRSGRANLATLNEQTHSLDLVGDANVFEGDQRTVADRFHYDMLDKSFHGTGDVRIFETLPSPAPSAAAPAKHKRRLPL